MDRRSFLTAAVVGVSPAVFGAGVGTAVVRGSDDDQGIGTAANSGPGLGIQRILWSGESDTDVALTFDDGPDPDLTPGLLDVLAAHDVRATFMVIGARVADRPDLLHRARAEGHEIGNHTWSHRSLATLDESAVREELERTAALIGDAKYFRPPRGVMTGVAAKVAAQHGYDVLLWSCATASLTTTAAVGAHLTSHVRPGTIVCMHDGLGRAGFSRWTFTARHMRARRAMELAALPDVLARASDRGVRFVTVSELVGPKANPVR